MKRNPKVGDVVRLYGKRAEMLVTEVTRAVAPWPPCVFRAVPAKATDPITGGIDAAKEKLFVIGDASQTAVVKKAKPITLEQIELTATAKFVTKKQYVVTKLTDIA